LNKRIFLSVFCTLFTVIGFVSTAKAQLNTYYITLDNLTTAGVGNGQPFSRFVFASHDGTEAFWTEGSPATSGIQNIAEMGDNSVLTADLNLAKTLTGSVGTIATASAGIAPGSSFSFYFTTDAAHPFLSSAWMLGWTNDGFAGIRQFDLSAVATSGPVTLNLLALDAGTEVNNEQAAFLAPLGGFLNDPEGGVVGAHPGIVGGADIPLSRAFSNPVARVSIVAAPEPGVLALLGLATPFISLLRRRRTA
jgi:Spondin_N